MLTGVVLAKNEAENLKCCLESLQFCDEVVVVNDNSTDETVKIAKKLGAKVLNHSLNNDYAAARNWALEEIKSPWVLFVDADEEVTAELATEIKSAIQKIECKGFLLPRRDFMWGKFLKHGDVGGVKLLRLARRGAGNWQGKVHETWAIEGQICSLKNPLNHYPHPDIVSFLKHINNYSTIKAQEFYKQDRKTNIWEITLGPIWRFGQLYLFKLGFLDGTVGFIHAMTMAFYMFLVSGKLYLRDRGIGNE